MKFTINGIETLEPIKTIAIAHTGDYTGIASSFERLGQWATQNNLWALSPRMIGIYHDDPSSVPTHLLRSHACIEDLGSATPAERMESYTITGGKYFTITFEVTMSEYGAAWCKVYSEVAAQGFECDARDHYELYLSAVDSTQGPDAAWNVKFCIPVK